MATITGAGLRGKGKALESAEDGGKARSNADHDNGNGQVSEIGSGTQAVASGPGKAISWNELAAAVKATNKHVTRAWHPDPPCHLIDIGNGVMAAVFTGDAAFQSTDGSIVRL